MIRSTPPAALCWSQGAVGSSYGRWGGRPPHRRFRTGRESFPSSGSSVHEPLSQARHWKQLLAPGAWQLHVWRWTFRPVLSPEWAQAPRLPETLPPPASMPSRVPAPCQHIPRITRGLRFLGHPTPSGLPAWSPAPVSVRAPDGFPRSGCPFFVALGRYFTPCPSHRADALGALNQDRMGTIPVLGLPVSRFGRFQLTTLPMYLRLLPIATCWGRHRLRLAVYPLLTLALRRVFTRHTT